MRDEAAMAAPKRQDTKKFFENLSGAGKSIGVLTSGGDAQGKVPRDPGPTPGSAGPCAPYLVGGGPSDPLGPSRTEP